MSTVWWVLIIAPLMWLTWRCLITIGRMDREQKVRDAEVAGLRKALQGTLLAIELIGMLLRKESGVDLTDDQVAAILNGAVSAGRAALGVEPGQPVT